MSVIKITRLSLATLAGAVLLILACLLLSLTQARAETKKDQAIATSLAEVTLEPEAKLLVTLGTGEKIKGKATNIGDGTLSVSTKYGIRTLRESKIVQIFQVKGTSRGGGALIGGLIGGLVTLFGVLSIPENAVADAPLFLILPIYLIPSGVGAAVGALVSGEEKKLVYQNPAVSPPSDFKTGLINFRDGQLSFGAPSIYLQANRFDGFRVKPFERRSKHIELLRVDF